MGIYYAAVDEGKKQWIEPPDNFSNKSPGIFSPYNPFSHMVIMKNLQGYNFKIQNDMEWGCYYERGDLKNVTNEVYQELLDSFSYAKDFYEKEWDLVFRPHAGMGL